MPEGFKTPKEQAFLIEDILPDSSGFFEDEPLGLDVAIEDADIVLDTNVLLIPYGAGASSLSEVVEIYAEIKGRNRLYIPAQVAREFVKNRPNKLAQLYQGISDRISKLTIPESLSYPILESVEAFQNLNKLISEVEEKKKILKESAKEVRETIKKWGWNDPVSKAYRPVFSNDIIISPSIDRDKVLEEMERRYKHAIPPGYKDASKPDGGIGDFLIWKTILSLGEKHKRSVVFVSGDEKADWLHGVEGSGFLPRFELQAEFRRMSEGHDIYIIPLSRLLELRKAEESSVKEIRTEENRIREATSVIVECPECESRDEYEISENIGSSALPECRTCERKFHLHRTKDGVITHRYNSAKTSSNAKKQVEIIECPNCGAENLKELGMAQNSTGWCICDDCEKKFPIHRRSDGSVYVNSNYDT
jgi:transposase-like protein/rRNA-processing protein FCF1